MEAEAASMKALDGRLHPDTCRLRLPALTYPRLSA